MMAAEVVSRAVAMLADARAQLPRLGDELLARHLLEILVHSWASALRQRLFDLVQVLATMLRAAQVDRAAGRRVLRE
jgi:hypothetical protein